jgi:CHAD domain-containing protein
MAKARPIEELSSSEPMGIGAARIIRVRTSELEDHSGDVLDLGDIERLHDMRVATRRLRAALEVFEVSFPEKRYGEVLEDVKKLADALGERRDRDVAIASLETFADGLAAPDRPGVRSLVETLRREQIEANVALAPAVAPEWVASLVARLNELADEAEGRAGPRPEQPEEMDQAPQAAEPPTERLAEGSSGNGAGALR